MQSLRLCGPDPRPITKAEALALSDIARRLPDNPVIVQIGAYWGVSTAVLLESRPDAFIFSVDIEPCPAERNTLIELGLNYRRVVRVLGDSAEIGIHWPYVCQLLFVDGDHTRNGIEGDCAAWLDKVDGYILFHDYIKGHERSEVYQVVNETFRQKPVVRVDSLIGFDYERTSP